MKKLVITALALTGGLASLTAMQAPKTQSLSRFGHTGAWVLPITTWRKPEGHVEYVILGLESRGRDRGTYDAFGGVCDKAKDSSRGFCHPVRTASREFAEEALTASTMGKNADAMRRHIDIDSGNTRAILALDDQRYNVKNVMYLTNFANTDIEQLKRKFPAARRRTRKSDEQEKDALATVRLELLKKAILRSKKNTGVTVTAEVITKQGAKSRQQITLRPVFVRIMRSYFEGKRGTPGKNQKIRFYRLR